MADETLDPLEAARREKLHKIEALGLDPWGHRFDDHKAIADVRQLPLPDDPETPGPRVRVAGRIMLRRGQGKVNFLQLRDWTEQIQIFIGKNQVGEAGWALAAELDLGDLLGVDGTLGRTKTGELTVFAEGLDVPRQEPAAPAREVARADRRREALPPALRRPVLAIPRVMQAFLGRTKVLAAFRKVLAERGFVEVETPDDAVDRRRRGGAAVRHASQRARPRALPADRARAAPQAAPRRRHGARLRDRPRLPQRGDQPQAQPRVHHAGGLSGLRRLPRA